jgi:hypothetical protein
MKIFDGKHEGPLTVSDQLRISGMVTGLLTVADGGVLYLSGMATDDVVVEPGGTLYLDGMATENVTNRGGTLVVSGMIVAALHEVDGKTEVEPGAHISGVER